MMHRVVDVLGCLTLLVGVGLGILVVGDVADRWLTRHQPPQLPDVTPHRRKGRVCHLWLH